jgi:hypothetical protein
MMGTSDPQPLMFYHTNLEQFVTTDHPMRRIRPLTDTDCIRTLCEPLYADAGRPSILRMSSGWPSAPGSG